MSILKCLLIISLSSLLACNKCNDIPINDVEIRFHNELGFDLVEATSGDTMYKGTDSFRSCSLVTRFDKIKDGELTEYKITHGNHLGYDNARVTYRRPEGHKRPVLASPEKFKSELIRNGAIVDSIANVFTGKMMHGLRLPAGNYTYRVFDLIEDKNIADIEIIRN